MHIAAADINAYREKHKVGLIAALRALKKQRMRALLSNINAGPKPLDPALTLILETLIEEY